MAGLLHLAPLEVLKTHLRYTSLRLTSSFSRKAPRTLVRSGRQTLQGSSPRCIATRSSILIWPFFKYLQPSR